MLTLTRKDFSITRYTLQEAAKYLYEHSDRWERFFLDVVNTIRGRTTSGQCPADTHLKLSVQPVPSTLGNRYMAVASYSITVSELPLDLLLQLQIDGWEVKHTPSEEKIDPLR